MRVLGVVAVDREVGCHAAGDELLLDVVAQQGELLVRVELEGQREFDRAGELGVAAGLGGFDGVPELQAVVGPVGRACGGEDLAVLDAGLAGVVEGDTGALLLEALAGAVGRGGHGAVAALAGDDLGGEVIDRNGGGSDFADVAQRRTSALLARRRARQHAPRATALQAGRP